MQRRSRHSTLLNRLVPWEVARAVRIVAPALGGKGARRRTSDSCRGGGCGATGRSLVLFDDGERGHAQNEDDDPDDLESTELFPEQEVRRHGRDGRELR